MVARLNPGELRALLTSGAEAALVDVREQKPYGDGHILVAVHAALSRLELDLPRLVPGRAARVVFCDGGEGLAERAVVVAAELGYDDLAVLDGGTPAWQAAGGRLFTGTNAPGAAFAETMDLVRPVPKMTAAELDRRRRAGEAIVVLDSRPWEDYLRGHIPGGIDCPGGELVYRARDLAPDPAIPVVVNCAARTRSFFGARSLIEAGLPNPVHALHEGTYGWGRAGLEPATGPGPYLTEVGAEGRAWSFAAADAFARRNGVREIDAATLAAWRDEAHRRCLYLLDVRTPEDYAAGHVAGALHAPGGQLVECAEDWIGAMAGRIVLLDDDGVRARMAAGWLRLLRHPNVFVLRPGEVVPRDETEPPAVSVSLPEVPRIAPGEARAVLDLSPGPAFLRGHAAGAVWAMRARLETCLSRLPPGPLGVMDDAGDTLACLAVADLHRVGRTDAALLPGGLDAWRAAGCPIATGEAGMLDAMDDTYYPPSDMVHDPMAESAAYIAWQLALPEAVEADGLLDYRAALGG